jgi:hypothetical protein
MRRHRRKNEICIDQLQFINIHPFSFLDLTNSYYPLLCSYGLPLETIRTDYKSGLESLLKKKPTRAIFLSTRNGDPNAVTPSNDPVLINLFCFYSTPLLVYIWHFAVIWGISPCSCIIRAHIITVWNCCRLVNKSSPLVHLAGLLSWGWTLSWIGPTGWAPDYSWTR